MNKTAIKNFAIWARNKIIADVKYQAGLIGITENGISNKLPQSVGMTEFYDIGTDTPYQITGDAIKQRDNLVRLLNNKAHESNYKTAYKYILEEVAYSWFNRLIAIRFMEVNDYLPGHIRVLSSESDGKLEPDIVSDPFNSDLSFSQQEISAVTEMKKNNDLDGLFKMLFIKTCNSLNSLLPGLFEETADYSELLLNLSVVDQDGVVSRLIHDIPEEDFDVKRGGQVEIIGWLYQYYNTDPKNEAFAKNGKTTKDEIPAVTQLFTPDWIVRYMVENSLGRLWLDGHPNNELKENWKYYMDEAEQEPEVQAQLQKIREEHAKLTPEDIRLIDPCMGSGHILVYAFDVLIQIYESVGYNKRDAAVKILENNIYGLDIDDRAYQLAYFAVMMKARQYNRRILTESVKCHVYSIQESNGITTALLHDMGVNLTSAEYSSAVDQIMRLIEEFHDAKEYGSILNITPCDWDFLRRFAISRNDVETGQIALDMHGEHEAAKRLQSLIDIAEVMSRNYDIAITNPPYLNFRSMGEKLLSFCSEEYSCSKADLFGVFIEKCQSLVKKNSYYALLTMQNWMYLDSFELLRKRLINTTCFVNAVHLGKNAFDPGAVGTIVKAISFVVRKAQYYNELSTFIDVRRAESATEKEECYLDTINSSSKGGVHFVHLESFRCIPGCNFAYRYSKNVFEAFVRSNFIGKYGKSLCGIQTGDNSRFLRVWFETNVNDIALGIKTNSDYVDSGKKWASQVKGGLYRKWYGNFDYIIDFYNQGYEISHAVNTNFRLRDPSFYFLRGLTWSHTSDKLSVRYLPAGNLCNVEAPTIYLLSEEHLYSTLAFLNSKVSGWLLEQLDDSLHFSVTDIDCLPYIETFVDEKMIKDNISICRVEWDSYETSWDFSRHPLLGGITMGRLIADKYKAWEEECNERFNQLKANEEELNRIFIDIYGLQDELTPEVEDKDVTVRKAELKRDIKSLLSYAVGCMFGRYSLDVEGLAYAGGDWDESKYQSFIPDKDNVIPITDEEYLEDDIVARLVTWIKVVYGEDTLEQNLDFIANALGNKGDSSRAVIRNYFLNDFFNDHCQTYSVTGSGKRPIYWLFDSGKQNGFKALIYLHRYNADTIGNLRVDYLHRIQRIYESEIARMQDTIDNSTNNRDIAQATKRKEKLTKQLKECREHDEKIGHLALSRIELDLDDGVKVNYKKLQTASDGLFYEVLANSKNIMVKEK